MWKLRVCLALALFGLAGGCGLLAWYWDALGIGLVGSLALWCGAGFLLWKALQALLGRVDVPQVQNLDRPAANPTTSRRPIAVPGAPPRPPQPPPGFSPSPAASSSGTSGTGTPGADGADGAALARAVGNAVSGTARTVWRAWVLLALVLLIPLALGLAVAGAVSLYGGDLPQGGIMLGVAGFLTWYCCGPLRGRWQADGTVLGGDGE